MRNQWFSHYENHSTYLFLNHQLNHCRDCRSTLPIEINAEGWDRNNDCLFYSLKLKWKSSFSSSALLALASISFSVLHCCSSLETFLPDGKRSRLKVNCDRKSFIFRCFSTEHFALLQPHGQDAIQQFFSDKEAIVVVDQWSTRSSFRQHSDSNTPTMEGDTERISCVWEIWLTMTFSIRKWKF
jgi:hypothetical protein